MKICFTLDDVLRGKTEQILKMYKKYIKSDLDISTVDISSADFWKELEFETVKEYNQFLYTDYSYEIFAEANPTEKGVDKDFIMWHMRLNNDPDAKEKFDVMFANPMEFNMSIGYTYFFLSKMATRVREIYLPQDSSDIWNKCDVLVTADSKLLNNKPEGKIAIKINMPYNKECPCDYEYDKLSELLQDETLTKKLIGDA